MKKAFGQTVRDLKRGVNKKVLKVPGIEQKVLDATSNESWGPHGSLLADIAHASRNYHEYQLTMGVLWKRLSDTGKNWRHVYKALTVLEYMVGHGSERVIDEIRERAYQISTLADFQYIDSSGKDQGSNVRKKSQSLVALVNDKERIAEVREKAAANRDKYRNSTVGGMQRPSGGYGDRYDYEGRYGDRDEGRSSYGREREYDDRNSRDGDRYSRDSEERYGRDGDREDEYRGRSRSVDNYQNGSRGRSSDREQPFEDDGQSSSRGSGGRADDHSQDGRVGLQRKFSEQNIGAAPPSYEEAVSESRSPAYSERDGGETPQVAPAGVDASPPAERSSVDNKDAGFVNESPPQQVEAFDEFDPRGSVSAAYVPTAGASAPVPSQPTVVSTSAPPASNNAEMDLLGSLSDVFAPNPLAIVISDSASVVTNGQANTGPAPSFSTSQPSTQPFDDPFGDSPFKAITSGDTDPSQHQSFGAPFQPTPPTSNPDNGNEFGFGESFLLFPILNLAFKVCKLHRIHPSSLKSSLMHHRAKLIFLPAFSRLLDRQFLCLNQIQQCQHPNFLLTVTCMKAFIPRRRLQIQTCQHRLRLVKLHNNITWLLIRKIFLEVCNSTMEASCNSQATRAQQIPNLHSMLLVCLHTQQVKLFITNQVLPLHQARKLLTLLHPVHQLVSLMVETS